MSVTDERLREILAEELALTSIADAEDVRNHDEGWRLTDALKAMRRAIAEDRAEREKGPGVPISRAEALKTSRAILETAEAERGGWIPWDGGECPVAPNVTVQYRLRDDYKVICEADSLNWRHAHVHRDSQVIAYRLVSPPKNWRDEPFTKGEFVDWLKNREAPGPDKYWDRKNARAFVDNAIQRAAEKKP